MEYCEVIYEMFHSLLDYRILLALLLELSGRMFLAV